MMVQFMKFKIQSMQVRLLWLVVVVVVVTCYISIRHLEPVSSIVSTSWLYNSLLNTTNHSINNVWLGSRTEALEGLQSRIINVRHSDFVSQYDGRNHAPVAPEKPSEPVDSNWRNETLSYDDKKRPKGNNNAIGQTDKTNSLKSKHDKLYEHLINSLNSRYLNKVNAKNINNTKRKELIKKALENLSRNETISKKRKIQSQTKLNYLSREGDLALPRTHLPDTGDLVSPRTHLPDTGDLVSPRTHLHDIGDSTYINGIHKDLYFEDLPRGGSKIPNDLINERPEDYHSAKVPLKKILYWNEAYDQHYFGFGYGREPFLRAGCAVDSCFATSDRTLFNEAELDAVIWHLRSYDQSFPETRSPETRYVFWMMESARNTYSNMSIFNHVFNWTFTYRLDSDFPNPYGLVLPRRKSKSRFKVSPDSYNKTKMAAWFVSNCNTGSQRETLARTLQKHIEIDIYGNCGWLRCERKTQTECYRMLERDYKFYLAFENSLCNDYVTEKFFNILKYNVVPVVYGLAHYEQHAPPHSYINVLDFPDVKALAEYLIYLDKNNTAYYEYFRWKTDYGQVKGWILGSIPWCSLCQRLHNDQEVSIYDNLESWFVDKSECKHRTNDRNISAFVHGDDLHPKIWQ